MDKIFLPNEKKWIFPPYPFAATTAQAPEEQVSGTAEAVSQNNTGCDRTGRDDVSYASGIQTDLLHFKEPNSGNESIRTNNNEVKHQQEVKCEGGFSPCEDVDSMIQITGPENSHILDSVDFWNNAPGCSKDMNISVVSKEGENSQVTLKSEEHASPPPNKRSRRRRKDIKEQVEQENEIITGVGGNWEGELRNNLAMSEEEFEEFTKSQGFGHQSSMLPHLFDFGVPDPKGMPKFATKIPDSYFEKSNTLRVYQNIMKPSYTSGSLFINATDQAFYKPEADASSAVPSGKDKVDTKDMIVTVECYHPSPPVSNDFSVDLKNARLPGVSVKVEILASQTLADLQSKLHCENDFVYVAEIDHPEEAKRLHWSNCACIYDKATFQSGVIFINDTIYTSDSGSNYDKIISNWAGQKFLGNPEKLQTGLLSTKLSDTSFKPGYPYLYRHNSCEHLLVFTNVRTIHPNDFQSLNSYPRVLFIHNLLPIRCRVNPQHIAKFVVKDNPRLPEPLVPLCTDCCTKFCYTLDDRARSRSREVKVGSFKLYPLIQKCMLPISDITM